MKKGPLATVAIVISLALEIPTAVLSLWFSWPTNPEAEALHHECREVGHGMASERMIPRDSVRLKENSPGERVPLGCVIVCRVREI